MEWELDDIDARTVIEEALVVSSGLLAEKSVRLEVKLDGRKLANAASPLTVTVRVNRTDGTRSKTVFRISR